MASCSVLLFRMSSTRTLRERTEKVVDDLVFVTLMLTGMVILWIFKPRYIGLTVRGYIRAVRRKHGKHTQANERT